MLPSMDPGKRKPVATRPHLTLKARPGWRFDDSRREFVSTAGTGDRVTVEAALPEDADVVARVPTASADAGSAAERDLACYWNVLLSEHDDLPKIAAGLRRLKCVERVEFPPEVALPGSDSSH